MITERVSSEYDELSEDQEVNQRSRSKNINHGYLELFAEYEDS